MIVIKSKTEVIRTPSRGLVQLFGNTYSGRHLVQVVPEGTPVRVRYDMQDPSHVWLLTMEGRVIGEAVKARQDIHDLQEGTQDERPATQAVELVERELVEALRNIAEMLSIVVSDFPSGDNRTLLLEAQQRISDVAFAQDLAAFNASDEARGLME